MAMRRRCYFSELLCCLVIGAFSLQCDAYTFAEWTFDSYDGMIVTPKYNTGNNFQADLSPLGSDINTILVPGIQNKSVYVDGKSFNLATGLGKTCIRDTDACGGSTWSITFWLKIIDWNNATNPVIFRTTNIDRTDAGIYIGKGEGDTILVYLRGSSGKTLSRTFSRDLVWNQWGKVYITGSRRITVTVNGTSQSARTTTEALESTQVTPANFVVGADNGPTFYLDDLAVRYHTSLSTTTSTIIATSTSPTITKTSPTSTTPSPTTTTTTSPTTSTTTSPPTTTTTTSPTTTTTTTPHTTTTTSPTTFSVSPTTTTTTSPTTTTTTTPHTTTTTSPTTSTVSPTTTTTTSPTTTTASPTTTTTATFSTTTTTTTATKTLPISTTTAFITTTTTTSKFPDVGTSQQTRALSTSTESTTSGGSHILGSFSNIWIPIVIALAVALLIASCLLWFLCYRRRKLNGEDLERQDEIPLSDMKNGYTRAPTADPSHDEASNHETDDNHTDQDESGGLLPSVKAKS